MKKHTTLKSKFNMAFSLIELLVVIAVIAVIAAIAIPNITGAREAAINAEAAADTAAVQRILSQALAAGATNSTGGDPDEAGLRGGTEYTTAQGVVFSIAGASTQ
jgi:prepilin-type N-terminal cleavage/methylation domain-containing protein